MEMTGKLSHTVEREQETMKTPNTGLGKQYQPPTNTALSQKKKLSQRLKVIQIPEKLNLLQYLSQGLKTSNP
jgi:hypothetical protein